MDFVFDVAVVGAVLAGASAACPSCAKANPDKSEVKIASVLNSFMMIFRGWFKNDSMFVIDRVIWLGDCLVA